MKFKWRTVAELVAVASVVLSLLFVGYELRLSRSVAISENFSRAYDRAANLRLALVENPEVWKKGCLGEQMTDEERIQFYSLVDLVGFRLFAAWQNAISGTEVLATPERFPRQIAASMVRFPAFRDAFLQYQSMQVDQSGAWQEEIERQYERLLSEGLEPEVDVAFCGR